MYPEQMLYACPSKKCSAMNNGHYNRYYKLQYCFKKFTISNFRRHINEFNQSIMEKTEIPIVLQNIRQEVGEPHRYANILFLNSKTCLTNFFKTLIAEQRRNRCSMERLYQNLGFSFTNKPTF